MPYGVRLQAAEWEAIRRSYEYDPDEPTPWEAARRAAEKHGFQLPSRQTIYNRQLAEKWERHSGLAGVVQAAHRKADRLVESDGSPTPAPPPPPETPAPKADRLTEAYQARQDAEDKRAEVLARHRQEWRQVAVLRQEALQLRQLDYKLAWNGGWLVVVPPQNTSRRCPACGHVAKENRVSQSQFECMACGYTAHADVNAARNILAAGHAVMACGGDVRPYLHLGAGGAAPMKQEPTEAIQCSITLN